MGGNAFVIAHDTLELDGVETTVLVVTARGSKTAGEYTGDLFKGWPDQQRQPFVLGPQVWDNVYDFEQTLWNGVRRYVMLHEDVRKAKNLKMLITGHSLGGAAANLLGARVTAGELYTESDLVNKPGEEWWLKPAAPVWADKLK